MTVSEVNLMSSSILVTGGAGYIGSVLVPELLRAGHRVTVLDNMMYSQNSLMDCCHYDNFSIVRGDCRDADTVRGLLKKADIIIPLAAIVGAPACDADKTAAESVNYEAVRMMLSERSSDQKVIFPCTNSGYGRGEEGKFCTEESPIRPVSLYGRTKVDAEKAVIDAGNSVTFRLATVFGISPRMRMDLLVNDFVYRAVTDRIVVVFEGNAKRNYIHIRDVVKAFTHVMDNFDAMRGETYNVGLSDANLSKLELCGEIKKVIPEFVYMEAAVGEDPDKRDYIVSNEKIEKTGFVPDWPLSRGIRELVKGYRILRNAVYSNLL